MSEFKRWLYNWRTSAAGAAASLCLSSVHWKHDEMLWFAGWLVVFILQAFAAVVGYRQEAAKGN